MNVKTSRSLNEECPLCRSRSFFSFFCWKSAVTEQQFVMKSRQEALRSKKSDIDLTFCTDCGFIWNRWFDPKLVEYSKAYEASQVHSKAFLECLKKLAADLVARYGLYGKTILEIGCGDSEFLRMLCRLGKNQGIGFDPSWKPKSQKELPETIQVIPEAYSMRHAYIQGDFICCRHVLEHVENPKQFLNQLKELHRDRKPIFFFEVPNVLWSLRKNAFWDFYYEHSLYFSRPSLERLFVSSEFDITGLHESFHGQYLCIEAGFAGQRAVKASPESAISELRVAVEHFKKQVQGMIRNCKLRINEWSKAGPLVIWGGGARATSFLNLLEFDEEQIKQVIDINPKKWGTFIPGTGQEIVSPQSAAKTHPAAILVLNPAYKEEIGRLMHESEISAKLIIFSMEEASDSRRLP